MYVYFFKRRDLYIVPIAYIAFGAVLYAMQDQLIYMPDDRVHGECSTLPGAVAIEADEVRGYYIPHTGSSTPNQLAVVYHGNAGNACDRSPFVPMLAEAGYSTLLVEYPGYAGDDQRASTQPILDNIPSVIKYVDSLEYNNVVLIGESIGSAFASYHATLADAETLILITPFDTLSARAQRAVWIYPAHRLLKADLLVSEWAQSAERVLIIAAELDEVIPRRHTDAVFNARNPETTTYEIIEDATHNTLYGDPRFFQTIQQYLAWNENTE